MSARPGDGGGQPLRALEHAGDRGGVDKGNARARDQALGAGDQPDVRRFEISGQGAKGLDVSVGQGLRERPESWIGRIASPATNRLLR